jgi:hypothetical protein
LANKRLGLVWGASTFNQVNEVAGMDASTWAVLIAAGALLMNFADKIFGTGSRLSGRLSTIEASMLSMQNEIKRLVDTLDKIADMRSDIRVIDTRLLAAEHDIRDLQHGKGFVQNRSLNQPGINGEYT